MHTKARTDHPSYPPRARVADDAVDWDATCVAYEPVEFTHPVVRANQTDVAPGGWADEAYVAVDTLLARDPSLQFDPESFRPLNPEGRTGMAGRGLLGKWGPNQAADAVITRYATSGAGGARALQVLLVQRADTGRWAFPGGMADFGETLAATTRRELIEETGIDEAQAARLFGECRRATLYEGYVDDERNTDHAWMVTIATHFHAPDDFAPALAARDADEVRAVRWVGVADLDPLAMHASHGAWLALLELPHALPPRRAHHNYYRYARIYSRDLALWCCGLVLAGCLWVHTTRFAHVPYHHLLPRPLGPAHRHVLEALRAPALAW